MKRKIAESCWLEPWERDEVIQTLLNSQGDVIKWDNNRKLPLKMGGTTDIYMNLRNARNDPKVLAMLVRMYENPLRRLGVQGFVEVPDGISCVAGPLALSMNIPYVTIREQAKDGRVAKSNLIGNLSRGGKFVIIDDVVTDGASKIIPARECLKAGVDLGPLVVLVDRQQGWRKKFQTEGLDLEVWPGMTLHDVRRYLIEHGIMERCRPDVEAKNPIIVALDGKDWLDILPIIDRLRTTGCILKVNDLLFWEGYKDLVPDLQVYGRVMVDIKGHDITKTLENIIQRFAKNPPWAVTVHASGGEEMIKKVVEGFAGKKTKTLAVTVLTSFDKATCQEIYSQLPWDEVKRLAAIAVRAGAHGLVCSPKEVHRLKVLYPKMELVTPGVRSPGVDPGDQKRVDTPARSMKLGARFLVMGRQILGSADPVAEVNRVLKEELSISL
ncbi:MAG: orotidine-5'-phosphate decarboxylase [Candidatus Paceibacterota bacterium]